MNKDNKVVDAASASSKTLNVEDPTLNSDGRIISDMVSKTAFSTDKSTSLNWLNPETGSLGVISTVEENGNSHCRIFRTSREAYDGVALYNGEICEVSPGVWEVQNFSPVDQ